MAEQNKIIIEVQSALNQIKASRDAISQAGGFSTEKGQNALNKSNNLISVLEKLTKGPLTIESLTNIRKNLNEVFGILNKYAAILPNVTQKFKDLSDAIKRATDNKINKEASLSQAKEARTAKLQEAKNTISEKRYAFYSKNENGSKSKLTSVKTIYERRNDPNLIVESADKTELTGDAKSQALSIFKDIEAQDKAIINLTADITKLDNGILVLKDRLKEESKKSNGNSTGADIITQNTDISTATDRLIGEEISKREDIKASGANYELTSKQLDKQSSSLGKAFRHFTLYSIAVRSARRALNDAKRTIQDLDKFLTEQAMVTGKTREETYKLLKSYQALAAQTGATTKEVAQVSTQFMRQGKTAQEALILTEAAISAAKVAAISATDSVNYLTTALNGFQMSAEDAMLVSDKFAAVAAQSASSYDEIAIALSKVASQANLAGMSIDYTTALLAKGLETTREAPETMGTALKTVIARMREMSDYGETLTGDTDVNNVETQLAYVGIALKNANGELRSTQDVLDELGQKWDTLNSNQQAAIAKALAGTRQQSRLIAMMTDYERVIELQEIAQQSQGATLAQMSTYMEGMEASLNKVSIAWEKIVASIANNDIIIKMVDGIANLLDFIGNILESEVVTVGLITTVIAVSLITLTEKWEIQKAINRAIIAETKERIIANKRDRISRLLAVQKNIEEKESLKTQILKTIQLKKQSIEQKVGLSEAQKAAMLANLTVQENAQLAKLQAELEPLYAEERVLKAEVTSYTLQEVQATMQIQKNAAGITSILSGALSFLSPILSILTTINMIESAIAAKKAKNISLTKAEAAAEVQALQPKAAGMFAGVVDAFSSGGIAGVIAGIAIATALVAALGIGIAASAGAFKSKTSKNADEIDSLSSSIYKLTNTSKELKTVVNQFEAIDEKILKTNDDLKEMTELLNNASDILTEDEQKTYGNLTTNRAKYEYLAALAIQKTAEAEQKRQEQLRLINKNRGAILDTTNTDYAAARDAIYATNNARLYALIDEAELTDDLASSTQTLTQALLEELSVEEALNYANDPNKIAGLIATLSTLKAADDYVANILTSDDYGLVAKVEAYKTALENLAGPALEAFAKTYNEYDIFAKMDKEVLQFIDDAGLTVDKLNTLYTAYDKLQKVGMNITKEEYQSRFDEILVSLQQTSGNIKMTIEEVFGDLLGQMNVTAEEYENIWNQLVNIMDAAVGESILNIGQNVDKLINKINTFYETASEWSTMTESDRTSFLTDYADLFAGKDGANLLKAFESGNYDLIADALLNNETLRTQIAEELAEVEQQIKIEEARVGDARNEALIAELKALRDSLQKTEELVQASLETRLEQQNKQLDAYKDYLDKERQALQESLDKRKEAYSKYFEEVNKSAEDEDYEEKAQLLIANISKLSSTTNGDAAAKRASLETELQNLEKERLQTLRERAQEQITQNIDDQVTQINEKFDKLLENEQMLLNAMTGQVNSEGIGFISSLLQSSFTNGNTTALGMQSYIQDLSSVFGGMDAYKDINWSAITTEQRGDQLVLNISGKEIILSDQDQQSIYTAITSALQQIGYR